MDGVGGVQVVCGRTGGAKGGCDLAGDDAALADASDDDAVLRKSRSQDEIDRLSEGGKHGAVEALSEVAEGGGFDAYEVGGEERICRNGGVVGHECSAMSMLAERFGLLDRLEQDCV